jgi:L-ascorbate metabolism protein UlaG (beta-lactamase superfamily)
VRVVGAAAAVLAAIASSACLPKALETVSEPPDPARVQVRFLGVGGFVIRRGPDVVMTAPLYSNPRAGDVAVGRIRSDPHVLGRYFAAHALEPEMTDLRAILVGHGHYDHLMDVPYFLDRAKGARVYGNLTTKRILAGLGHDVARRVTALNDPSDPVADFTNCPEDDGEGCVRFPGQAGRWLDLEGTDGRVRIRAFCSCHPPQVLHAIHFWPGCLADDLSSPPTRADEYPEGEVLAFLVDFMEDGRPAFRVYYQDAPVARPDGWVPETVIADRPVDLALLCAGNFDAVKNPESIVSENLRAAAVVIHHWEDFFDPTHSELKMIPGCDVNAFYKHVLARVGGDRTRVHVLAPGVLRNFP